MKSFGVSRDPITRAILHGEILYGSSGNSGEKISKPDKIIVRIKFPLDRSLNDRFQESLKTPNYYAFGSLKRSC